MKKYIFLIIISFISLTYFVSASNNLPLIGKVIVIDPGHGYKDPGTVFNDVYEKDLNLIISLKLRNVLEKNGATVLMTRDGDYDLSSPNAMFRKKSDFDNRIKLINNSNADLYLSIHQNFLDDSSYFGPQVFYKIEDISLAKIMQKYLNEGSFSNRDIKLIPSDTYMYKKLKLKGLLIECGFLSNKVDRENLLKEDYQDKITKTITNALIDYFT
jgi:N-acetylmuramoyl-L-alanine amidase